jgi:hypothetical protein
MLSRLVRTLFQTDPVGRRPQGNMPVRYRPLYELLEMREVPATFLLRAWRTAVPTMAAKAT